MNSDATNLDLALSAYSAVAGFIGHAVLGAIVLAAIGGGGWLGFLYGRRWLLNRRAMADARRAGWRCDAERWQWVSPDGLTTVSEVMSPGEWSIYRGKSYSSKEYPLHYALRWAMLPPEMTPWVRMVKPGGGS